jgi:hypothetical protein
MTDENGQLTDYTYTQDAVLSTIAAADANDKLASAAEKVAEVFNTLS